MTPRPAGGERPSAARSLLSYQPALDGLRGLAFLSIVVYHAQLSWMPGAFLSVSTFFTVSGFLITVVLLSEEDRSGTISRRGFWARRLRRLLPAALVAITVITVVAAHLTDPAQLRNLKGDALASLFYVANWRFIINGSSYQALFESPSPFAHFWTLAIEEQFYFVYPLLLGGLLVATRTRRRWIAPVVLAVLALGSAAWSARLFHTGASLDRIYFGTDTRMGELLVGAVAAFVWLRFRGWLESPAVRRWVGAVGLAALAFMLALWATCHLSQTFFYQGGLTLYALVTVGVIIAGVQPAGSTRRVLAAAPLVWVGLRSYGAYLAHWPILLLLEQQTDLGPLGRFVIALPVTLVIAWLSYRWIERPIHEGRAISGQRAILAAPAGMAVVVVVVLVAGTTIAPSALATLDEPVQEDAPVVVDDELDVVVIADELSAPVAAELAAMDDGASLQVTVAEPFGCAEVTGAADAPVCPAWADEWPALVDGADPDVVLVMVSGWPTEIMQSLAALPAGSPPSALEEWAASLFGGAFTELTDGGATVLWMPLNGVDDAGAPMKSTQSPFFLAMERLFAEGTTLRRGHDSFLPPREASPATQQAWGETVAAGLLDELRLYDRRSGGAERRVLVVGDSTARTLAYGLEQWGEESGSAVVWSAATDGCGMSSEGAVTDPQGVTAPLTETCDPPHPRWDEQVATFDPDVVVVLSTTWDLQPRVLPDLDGLRTVDDPAFQDFLVDAYSEAVDTLSARGARVVWVTSPCMGAAPFEEYWGVVPRGEEFDPENVRLLDEVVLPRLQEARPDRVSLFDLRSVLCPDGTFVRDLGGVEDVRPDGMHFSPEGSRWLADTYGTEILTGSTD